MKISRIGMDIAKSVVQVHAVDGHGKVLLRKKLKRSELLGLTA